MHDTWEQLVLEGERNRGWGYGLGEGCCVRDTEGFMGMDVAAAVGGVTGASRSPHSQCANIGDFGVCRYNYINGNMSDGAQTAAEPSAECGEWAGDKDC